MQKSFHAKTEHASITEIQIFGVRKINRWLKVRARCFSRRQRSQGIGLFDGEKYRGHGAVGPQPDLAVPVHQGRKGRHLNARGGTLLKIEPKNFAWLS